MSHILVTGGAGLIGSNLCKALLDKGHKVIAIDNFITSTGENIKSLLQHPNFHFIEHDITKPFNFISEHHKIQEGVVANQKLKSTTSQPGSIVEYTQSTLTNVADLVDQGEHTLQYIYHLACPTGVPNVELLAEEMLMTCSVGTRNALELARQTGAQFLLTSTSEVYGDPEIFPQDETYTGNVDPIGIRSAYEEGKRFSESLVSMYVRKYKLNAKIVRIFNTYGPGMSLADTRVLSRFINAVKKNEPLPVQGAGKQQRTFCYVDDLVKGLLLVMEKGTPGEVYNLGSDNSISIDDLAHLVLDISGSTQQVQYIQRPSHDHQSRMPALTKVKALGWKPQVSLEDGLKRTIGWYNGS